MKLNNLIYATNLNSKSNIYKAIAYKTINVDKKEAKMLMDQCIEMEIFGPQ